MKAGDPSHGSIPVGIALGSNEGNRLANLEEARARITMLSQAIHGPSAACVSAPVFETDPVDCAPGSERFLNTVIEIACERASFSPVAMLAGLRGIENALGRPTRRPRNAPRTIDLDVLYTGEVRTYRPELTVPHPRLAQRRFVLAPLAVIRPDLVLPGETRPVSELLLALETEEKVTLYAKCW